MPLPTLVESELEELTERNIWSVRGCNGEMMEVVKWHGNEA